jgi:hypothetical protein
MLSLRLFVYPHEVAQRIEGLCKEHTPEAGQSVGPLPVTDGLELFIRGYKGTRVAWIVDRWLGFAVKPEEVLTPANLARVEGGRSVVQFGLLAKQPASLFARYTGLPEGFAERYFRQN